MFHTEVILTPCCLYPIMILSPVTHWSVYLWNTPNIHHMSTDVAEPDPDLNIISKCLLESCSDAYRCACPQSLQIFPQTLSFFLIYSSRNFVGCLLDFSATLPDAGAYFLPSSLTNQHLLTPALNKCYAIFLWIRFSRDCTCIIWFWRYHGPTLVYCISSFPNV